MNQRHNLLSVLLQVGYGLFVIKILHLKKLRKVTRVFKINPSFLFILNLYLLKKYDIIFDMKEHSWPIIGHNQAINFFEHLLSYEQRLPGNLGGSYILSGLTETGRMSTLTVFLEKLANLAHYKHSAYDIARLHILNDKKEIGIAQAREFTNQMSLSSFGSYYRIGIIESAEYLSLEAANALLKTLEDARDQAIIFLITTSPDQLPATIRSRSQIISFNPVSADIMYEWLIDSHKVVRTQAKHISRLANGRPGTALSLLQDKKLIEEYVAPVRLLCSALTSSLYERWQMVDKLLGSAKSSDVGLRAHSIISHWRLGLRDILLLHLNRPELVVHTLLQDELLLATKRLNPFDIRRYDRILERANTYIRSNINPKLVLEQAMMNIQ